MTRNAATQRNVNLKVKKAEENITFSNANVRKHFAPLTREVQGSEDAVLKRENAWKKINSITF